MNDAETKKHIVIGLTGQTGAGKTSVSGLLRSRLFPVIDADVVSRRVVEKGRKCLVDLVLAFGVEILAPDGSLCRRKMGSLVFGSKEKRMRFNEIVFPYIGEEIRAEIEREAEKGASVIFLDAPTLFESGADKTCGKVVSVIAPRETRKERLLARDSDRTAEELEARLNAQHDDAFYTSRSNFVILNDGDWASLRVQVLEMLEFCCQGLPRPDDELPEEE